jgi:PAS domain S-box-containing protein
VVEAAIEGCLTRGSAWSLELEMETARGEKRWVRSIGERDAAGEYVIGTTQDITRLKQAELDRAEAHRQLKAIVDGTSDAIAAVDLTHRYVTFNAAYSRHLEKRYARRPMVGMRVSDVLDPWTEAQAHMRDLWKRALRGESFVETEAEDDLMEEGSVFELQFNPIYDEKGEIIGAVHVLRDVTERARVDKLKSEFISIVNHELRTPLTSLSGALAMLDAGTFGTMPGEAVPMLELALRNAQRLGYLIGDLLDLQNIGSGRIRLTYRRIDVDRFLREAYEEGRRFEDQHDAQIQCFAESTGAEIYGDEHRLKKVMEHLISNAAKFSSSGGRVELHAGVVEDHLRVSVRDDGPGIAESFAPHVFEPFRQGESVLGRNHDGTGLGLSVCKNIVDGHGGRIGFEPNPESGTTFYFELPLAPQHRRDFGLALKPGDSILICEDDADVALTLRYRLEAVGFLVDVAHSADVANRCVREKDYALITLDLRLPDMDGLALLEAWRNEEHTRDIPVLIISGHLDEEVSRNLTPMFPGVSYLSKPVDETLLIHYLTAMSKN